MRCAIFVEGIAVSRIGDFLRHQVFGHQAPKRFYRGLIIEIKEQLLQDPIPIVEKIEERAEDIKNIDIDMAIDPPSLGHVELCSSILAAYQELLPVLGSKEATLQFVGRAMMRGMNTSSMRFSMWLMLYSSKGNPDTLRDIFKMLMQQYGGTFSWTTTHRDDKKQHSFTVEIDRCFYFDFFSAHDVAFLTPVLCQIDSLWFDKIDPKTHGFYFDKSRYKTQGHGAKRCIFPIVESKRDKGN